MTKYQIALFSNGADDLTNTLRETLITRLKELGVAQDLVSFFDESTIASRDPKAPTVGAFVSIGRNPSPRPEIERLVQNGTMVVPVVENLSQFNSYVFPSLSGINGMELRSDDLKLERVGAVLLEGLNLLRRSRRLFISYRRSETQAVAIQLYEALDHHGFDVFLDTVSIRPGEPFQEVLWHRLADTDVIVLLDTPGFMQSRWTVQELARANSTSIQMLQLVWPTHHFETSAAFSKVISLTHNEFTSSAFTGADARLKESMIERLTVEVESLRARALAARHSYLVEEFCADARSLGLVPYVQPERFIAVEPRSGVLVAAVPTVGIPDAVRYQEIADQIERYPKKHTEVVLLFDERGIYSKWLTHLEWLDGHRLPVRSLQVAESTRWLKSLI
jgi:TIR domain